MLVKNIQEPISVCLVPKDLEVGVVVVAEVDMRLRDEVLVLIVIQSLFDPIEHLSSSLTLRPVLVEGVHAVKVHNHNFRCDLICVPSACHPGLFDSFILDDLCVGRDIFEEDLPEVTIVRFFHVGSWSLIVVRYVIVADHRKDWNVREGINDCFDSCLHSEHHQRPLIGW